MLLRSDETQLAVRAYISDLITAFAASLCRLEQCTTCSMEDQLTSEAKESVGARVPDVRMTQRALSVSSLKATAGLRDQRHSCTAQPDTADSSSSSTTLCVSQISTHSVCPIRTGMCFMVMLSRFEIA